MNAPPSVYEIHFDGGFREKGYGGRCSWGWLATRSSSRVAEDKGVLDYYHGATNMHAEAEGLVRAARWAAQHWPDKEIEFIGDSHTLFKQLDGLVSVYDKVVRKHLAEVRLLRRGTRWRFRWVPRCQNKEADRLTRRAIGEAWIDERLRIAALPRNLRRVEALANEALARDRKARIEEKAMKRHGRVS